MAKKVSKETLAMIVARNELEASIAHLTKQQKSVVEEACRRGHDMSEEVEAQVMQYGRWLFEAIFKNDASAALDERSSNPIWLDLVRRAGGPTLRVSRNLLYTSLQLAARDKRISDQAWQNLDAPRKELLLPLKDDAKIRAAAHHVSSFNLTQTKTRQYVTALLSSSNKDRQSRMTPKAFVGRVRSVRESLGANTILRRVKGFQHDLKDGEAEEIADEIEKLKSVLTALSRAVRGR